MKNPLDYLDIVQDSSRLVIIRKKDKGAAWPNNDCSDKTLLGLVGRADETPVRVLFKDDLGIGDAICFYF